MEISKLYRLYKSCNGLTTDSRSISEGIMFFALKGDTFDGNDFAEKAIASGAKYAVVDRVSLSSCSQCIVVDDVLTTLQNLARYHRSQYDIPVIAITGTNGKTTTKEFVSAVLSTKYNVVATQGNLNNHIGVPLTLFGIDASTEIVVIEMGASAQGEISFLTGIALPTFGLVTNVGKAHLLGFGSFDMVKKTKGELYDFIAGKSGTIFYNADNPYLCEMISSRPEVKSVKYGLDFQGALVLPVTVSSPYLRIDMPGYGEISTNLIGSYNADNILAALCVGKYFNVEGNAAVSAIKAYIPSNNRSQLVHTERNLLIVDAYNANPTSMRASLKNFAETEFPSKTLILGDMLELGSDSLEEHKLILELIFSICSDTDPFVSGVLFFVGREFMKAADDLQTKNRKGMDFVFSERFFDTSEELREYLKINPLNCRSILIKGSRGNKLEKVLEVL
ncbi:MAG: UDP-N-acetylmuramoyl-tripeptide--D-alanyl-D-alanine ligase [Bacteroidales bacterium]|nr:UDP-N-acetylmuramoyl-tripeptide--D-alanyl-D-alanine ligase [Bacteroidales bacterium]